MRLTLIVHERRGRWARRLKPLVAGWGARLVESRSADDLTSAMAAAACPIVVLDLGERLRPGLDDLGRAARASSNALFLVLDGTKISGCPSLARELGATLVLPATTPPPRVFEILARWLTLARDRSEAEGWAEDRRPEPEPWQEYLDAPIGTRQPAI